VDGTVRELQVLRAELEAAGVAHTIVTDSAPKRFGRRVPYLAAVRNRALHPLRGARGPNGNAYDAVIFFNDIVFHVRRCVLPKPHSVRAC
jgi:hypothetical protein